MRKEKLEIIFSGKNKKTLFLQKMVISMLTFTIKNVRKKYAVHRLIAETFLPNPNNKICINHIDGNRLNNSITNLEWCSYSENNLGVRNELIKAIRYEEIRKKRGGGHISWGKVMEIKFLNL